MHLNMGKGGLSQIGKYITAYAGEPEQARSLCISLSNALKHFEGPRVPSDARVPGSRVVHYRYGSFENQWRMTEQGLWEPALEVGGGILSEDKRDTNYVRPGGVAPLFPGEDDQAQTILKRYTICSEIARTHKSAIFVAYDRTANDFIAIKQAFAATYPYSDRTLGTSLLKKEAKLLRLLNGRARAPKLFDLWDDSGDAFMAFELLGGVPLPEALGLKRATEGRGFNVVESLRIFSAIVESVSALHRMHLVHRDIKPANIIIDPNDYSNVWLIDFETAAPLGSQGVSAATRGYRKGSLGERGMASFEEDLFALGALLVYLLMGFDFSYMPDESVDRLLFLDSSSVRVSQSIRELARFCLEPPAASNTSAVETVAELLESWKSQGWRPSQPLLTVSTRTRLRPSFALLEQALERSIRSMAEVSSTPPRRWWRSAHGYAYGRSYPYLNVGGGGVLIYLAFRQMANGSAGLKSEIQQAAHTLQYWKDRRESESYGLYMGGHGVAVSVACAASITNDSEQAEWSVSKIETLSSQPLDRFDLFHGVPGAALGGLWVDTVAGRAPDPERAVYQALSHIAEASSGDLIRFAKNQLQGAVGMAHGLAGIGHACSEVAEVTGSASLLRCAVSIGELLLKMRKNVRRSAKAWFWPSFVDQDTSSLGWCHGTAGIGQFLLDLWWLTQESRYLDAAETACRSLDRYADWMDSTQCHGIAGAVELMLDLEQASRERRWRLRAERLTHQLMLRSSVIEGGLVWTAESPEIISPDLLVGMAGIGVCLQRFSTPSMPRALSLRGMRWLHEQATSRTTSPATRGE